MSSFAFLVLCIQACLIHNAYTACIGSVGYANSLGGLRSLGCSSPCNGLYGGVGEGNIAVAGELPVQGYTVVGGQVPCIGAVQFGGNVPSAGSVSIAGNCGCGCGTGAGYYY